MNSLNTNTSKTTIPNTLTIFVNTRIRNHRNFKYTPAMTTPGEKSTVVCFDPLVQLNTNIVSRIPTGYPKETVYTQFFRRNEFTSLLSRSLNTFPYKVPDLLSAKYQGIVDHNIRATLDTLFRSGNPFYIDGQRFTVNSYEWFNGDWQIGTKIFEQALTSRIPFSTSIPYYGSTASSTTIGLGLGLGSAPGTPITASQLISPVNAQIGINELNDIPQDAIKGEASSTSSKIEKAIVLNTGVKTISATSAAQPTGGLSSLFAMPALANPSTTVGPPAPAYLNPDAKKAVNVIQQRIQSIVTPSSSGNAAPILTPLEKLHLNFMNAYNQGVREDLISPGKSGQLEAYLDEINNWQIKANNAGGDCLFYAVADILNSDQNGMGSRSGPILFPHKYDAAIKAAVPVNPNPYMDPTTNTYSARLLRKAFVDYLDEKPDIFSQYLDGGKQDAQFHPERWRFMQNNAGDNFLPDNEIKRIMRIPADKKSRDTTLDGPDLKGDHRYYWGDELAITCLEDVFQVKLIIINTEPRTNNPPHEANHIKIKLDSGEEKIGIVVSDERNGVVVELEDYTQVRVSSDKIDKSFVDDNYSVYCVNTIGGANFSTIDKFAFLLYDPRGPHFEALYVTKREKQQYIITSVDLIPSYIKYLIFLYCYRFINDAQKPTSPYGQISGFKSIFDKLIKIIDEKIQNTTLPLEEREKVRQINPSRKLHFGGAGGPSLPQAVPVPVPTQVAPTAPVQAVPVAQVTGAKQNPLLTNITGKYLQETPQFAAYDTRIGYYIVIDLELSPGESVSLGQSIVIGCNNRYEKIWTAMAEIAGLPYQPKEIVPPLPTKKSPEPTSTNPDKKDELKQSNEQNNNPGPGVNVTQTAGRNSKRVRVTKKRRPIKSLRKTKSTR